MVAVQTTTDEYPPLGEHIAQRQAKGLDTHDEWWTGAYRIVVGPSPEHGELLDDLAELLLPLVRAEGLKSAAPANIGVDKWDCRVPDRAIFEPDTPRTSPAFLATALLVIEVLSPGEKAKEKLPFYRDAGVKEYLEIDLAERTAELWRWSESLAGLDNRWEHTDVSEILPGLVIENGHCIVSPDSRICVDAYLGGSSHGFAR